MKNSLCIICSLLILASCNRNNCIKNDCIHIRKWVVYNPFDDNYSVKIDTFNTKFIKEIGIAKVVFDSLLKVNSNKLDQIISFSDNNIVIEAKKKIYDQNKTVEVFRISSYNNGIETLFLYSIDYGTLLRYSLKKRYALEYEFTYQGKEIKYYTPLMESIIKDSSLMVFPKIKFKNP